MNLQLRHSPEAPKPEAPEWRRPLVAKVPLSETAYNAGSPIDGGSTGEFPTPPG